MKYEICILYGMYNGRDTDRPKEREADTREVEKNSERQMDA
jgi:hypothetical protein